MNSKFRGPKIGSTTASFVFLLLVVSGGVGAASTMQSGTRTGSEIASNVASGLLIHIVNETSGQPLAGFAVTAGPISSPADMAPTFAGPWTLQECIYEVPSGSAVWTNETVALANGKETTFTCPLSGYQTNSTGWVSIPNAVGRYYFFNVGGWIGIPNIHGAVPLRPGVVTQVTINWPNGNYTVTD